MGDFGLGNVHIEIFKRLEILWSSALMVQACFWISNSYLTRAGHDAGEAWGYLDKVAPYPRIY
jgi:hypothetical protein